MRFALADVDAAGRLPKLFRMAVPIHVVDAFTTEAFRGNPAGVVVTDAPLAPALLPKIAAEMRNSETAFAVPAADGSYALRWLTPTTEVDLCGHATLATAHVLRETGRVAEDATIRRAVQRPWRCRRGGDGGRTREAPRPRAYDPPRRAPRVKSANDQYPSAVIGAACSS